MGPGIRKKGQLEGSVRLLCSSNLAIHLLKEYEAKEVMLKQQPLELVQCDEQQNYS